MKTFLIALMIGLSIGGGTACSRHVPPALQAKAAATYTLRDVNDALHAAYVLETSNSGVVPAAAQKQVLLAFATAFDRVAHAATVLQTVQPGTSVPDTLKDVLNVVKETAAAAGAVGLPANVIAAINKAVAIAQAVYDASKGGGL
jgi:hypothetical protein